MSKINSRYIYNEATCEHMVTFMNGDNGNCVSVPSRRMRDDLALAKNDSETWRVFSPLHDEAICKKVVESLDDMNELIISWRRAFNV